MTTITNPDALTETFDPAGHIDGTVLPHWKGGAPFAGSSTGPPMCTTRPPGG